MNSGFMCANKSLNINKRLALANKTNHSQRTVGVPRALRYYFCSCHKNANYVRS